MLGGGYVVTAGFQFDNDFSISVVFPDLDLPTIETDGRHMAPP